MKKQILLSFFCGMVVPLLLMAVGSSLSRQPAPAEAESDGLSQNVQQPSIDEATVLTVLSDTGNLRQMTLEDYLVGVVLAEMPADFSEEALKAQAVVVRTYTCKRSQGMGKHDAAAVCMDAGCCQGYVEPEEYLAQGGGEIGLQKVRSAIEKTDGCVLTYDGALIDATYFSCSGGSTEDAVAVWGQDVPYLQSVESPGEEDAPRYSETVSFSPAEFVERTGCGGNGRAEDWFGAVSYTDGGGVDTMVICGREYTGVELRRLLGLRSTAFDIQVEGEKIQIQTRGFGHRVGMSQYGAQAMAKNGSDYTQILAHYYQGTELGRMEG